MEYIEIASLAVEEAQKRGAAAAEAYLLDADALTVEVSDQRLETLKLAKDTGIGLRVISANGAVGFAYSTDISREEIRQVAERALGSSRSSFADPHHTLPGPVPGEQRITLTDGTLAETPVEEKIEMARAAEKAAKRYDPRVRKAERCIYQDSTYGVTLVNSNGIANQYRSGYCGIYCSVLAAEAADIQSGMSLYYGRSLKQLNPDVLGKEAARQAVMLMGARPVSTARVPVVLSPYVATNFLSVLSSSFSADAVQKGKSMLQGKLGQQVLADQVTVIDDGTLTNGIATAPWDGEGVPAQRTVLMEKGVLTSYLHNTYTASREKTSSTGNGIRNSFKSATDVGPTNIFIKAGRSELEVLIKSIANGFYITGVMGLHTANPISGDFSLGAAGVWIENGEFTHAVRGVAIAGNLLELFGRIEGVGSDLTFFGSRGAPTLKIADVTVSA